MRKLIVKGGTLEQEYPLIDTTIIGRASSSTIRLDASKVADEHAKISKTGPNIFVEDLDTPNGITVNGKKVARWALKKGDLIGVGAVTLLYDEDDKPDPAPKPKAPIPDAQKSATNITPVKSAAPKNASKATLPAVNGKSSANLPAANGKSAANLPIANGKSAANLPAAKASDSVKTLDATKSKDDGSAKAEKGENPASKPEVKPTEPKPAEPKPVEPKPAEPKAASGKVPAAKSSALMAAVIAKSSSSGRIPSSKSSQSLSAVTNPGTLNDGNSSRINIGPSKSVGGTSAVGMGAVGSPSGKSGIMPSAKLRLSGTMPAVGGGGNDSSTRLGAASAAALIAQRMANTPASSSGMQAPVTTGLPSSRVLLIAVGVLCFLVLVLGGILVATMMRSSGPTTDEKAALVRLHAKGPKASDDLQFAMARLRAVRTISDVQEILGEPEVKTTGEFPLWDPQMGTTKYPGQAFIGYYISDQGAPSAIEEAPVVNVLLFLITDSRVEFMGPRKYARIAQGPEKKAEPEAHTGPAAPLDNPSPISIKNAPPPPLPNSGGSTPPPALPLPEDKPPH